MNNIDFTRGELVGTARALLALHMASSDTQAGAKELDKLFEFQHHELRRLVNNEFQLHGHDLGCPVQFALTVLLMNGEQHLASQRQGR